MCGSLVRDLIISRGSTKPTSEGWVGLFASRTDVTEPAACMYTFLCIIVVSGMYPLLNNDGPAVPVYSSLARGWCDSAFQGRLLCGLWPRTS